MMMHQQQEKLAEGQKENVSAKRSETVVSTDYTLQYQHIWWRRKARTQQPFARDFNDIGSRE
jgi:hypothetical protein